LHNDLGMAVAKLARRVKGGGQIECTINGIGERAGTPRSKRCDGDAVRNDVLRSGRHRPTMLMRARSSCAATSFRAVQQSNRRAMRSRTKAASIRRHVKNAQTYEIMLPESVGVKQTCS